MDIHVCLSPCKHYIMIWKESNIFPPLVPWLLVWLASALDFLFYNLLSLTPLIIYFSSISEVYLWRDWTSQNDFCVNTILFISYHYLLLKHLKYLVSEDHLIFSWHYTIIPHFFLALISFPQISHIMLVWGAIEDSWCIEIHTPSLLPVLYIRTSWYTWEILYWRRFYLVYFLPTDS